ncbi:MAG: DUF2460 domain-containing protein [Bryobacteraceae bacterium]
MADFPVLKTGAVAQYPASRAIEYSTRVLWFVDGSEQRYRQHAAATRRWVIELSLLDEEEMASIEAFFQSEQGQFGNFAFTDPFSGTTYSNCNLENDRIELAYEDVLRGCSKLVIKENVS